MRTVPDRRRGSARRRCGDVGLREVGAGRALREEVTWDASGLRTIDWKRYKSFQFGDSIPEIEAVLIDRKDKAQMGAGESSITLSASAISNAVFDATGARLRQVPFTPERVLAALKERG